MTKRSEVKTARSQLITSVRTFVEEQVETWRLVPLLALQADGRDGGMGHYFHAYKNGMWELHIANDNLHNVFVDCATGSLRSFMFEAAGGVFRPVHEDAIVRLSNHLEHLDAEQVVATLRAHIHKPLPSWITLEQAAEREARRTRIQRTLKLTERYARLEDMVSA